MKKSKVQSRRPMPKPRHEQKVRVLTVGDLISAAFDALGDAGQVARVLGSRGLSERVGRKLAFI
jgi:hypothetical protein